MEFHEDADYQVEEESMDTLEDGDDGLTAMDTLEEGDDGLKVKYATAAGDGSDHRTWENHPSRSLKDRGQAKRANHPSLITVQKTWETTQVAH